MAERKHRHVWQATLFDGSWVEYCASLCGVAHRKARLRPSGAPVALARYKNVTRAEGAAARAALPAEGTEAER